MSTATYGNSAPSDLAINLDSVFAQSLANYRKTLVDNIGATNSFLYELIKSGQYESADGGTNIQETLMYALAPMSWYSGYDTLSTLPTDGITNAVYDWSQAASPITYSMKEVIQNEKKILDLVKGRIKQAEMGIQEGWAQAFWWGQGNGALATPVTDVGNGAQGIDPIAKMIAKDPTASVSVGNINQNTYSWWRNRSVDFSGVTTYSGLILKLDHLYNSCALGTGGAPNLVVTDQVTYELINAAYYWKYRQTGNEPQNYPFEATKFKKAMLVMDDKVPDVQNGTIPSVSAADSPTLTAGSIFVMNTQFYKVRYHPSRNWEMLPDENGKTFVKPANQDARTGSIAWMGAITCSNRRKQGVGWGVPRTLTAA